MILKLLKKRIAPNELVVGITTQGWIIVTKRPDEYLVRKILSDGPEVVVLPDGVVFASGCAVVGGV